MKKGNAEFCLTETRVHLRVERNRGLTFITAFRISTRRNTDVQLFHGTMDVDPRMGSLSWL